MPRDGTPLKRKYKIANGNVVNAETGEVMCGRRVKGKKGDRGYKGRCTNHCSKGFNCCRTHGGAAAKASITHGKYAQFAPTLLGDRIKAFEADPNLKRLREEIVLLRAILSTQLARIEGERRAMDGPTAEALYKGIDFIRRAVESAVKTEEGLKFTLDVTQIDRAIQHIGTSLKAIVDDVCDEETATKINKRMAKVIMDVPLLGRL